MAKVALLLCVCVLAVFASVNGHTEKKKVGFYELKRGDMSLKFTNWGATLVSFVLPDKNGKLTDIVLGYDTIDEYKNDTTYFGAIVGRVANRIGGAKYKLNGVTYKLEANEGKNMLHGGPKGYSDVVWKVTKYDNKGHNPHIVFTYHSFDGEEGFPGEILVTVRYTLLADNQLSLVMKAKNLGRKTTPVNLAQHAYWNLGGHNSGDILSEKIQIFASNYTPVDSELIPTGKIEAVQGTPFDFLKPKTIGSRIKQLPNGYDINYALDGVKGCKVRKAALVHDEKSGIEMEISTNAPGLQFYTGNMIKNSKGKDGSVYKAHAAICLETQWYPDYVNNPQWPQSIMHGGKDKYKHEMLYKFSTH
ncbi:unnamed protein product [Dovyalis caffra]|uniref:Aldose 1-epimerase n=1 Tax=Dovyalis caffra TaxID=77055 RepID=A0AAV1QRR0_9ROSI|nr:unnamed protein product [Dovyalis caffra]